MTEVIFFLGAWYITGSFLAAIGISIACLFAILIFSSIFTFISVFIELKRETDERRQKAIAEKLGA